MTVNLAQKKYFEHFQTYAHFITELPSSSSSDTGDSENADAFEDAIRFFSSERVRDEVRGRFREIRESNGDVDEDRLGEIERVAVMNVRNAQLVEKDKDLPKTGDEVAFENELAREIVISNPYVEQEVGPRPILLSDYRETQSIVEDTSIPISIENPDSVYRIFGAIAKQNSMTLVRNSDPADVARTRGTDAVARRVDFSLQSATLTEDSLFLMGSEDPRHHVKAITVTLSRAYEKVPVGKKERESYVQDIKSQLALAHGVPASDIIIQSVERGSVNVIYTVRSLPFTVLNGLPSRLKAKIPEFVDIKLHASFLIMNLNATSFAPAWNRDFGDPSRCPVGAKRGGLEYKPPKGFMRFGLKVAGKYDGGDDTWLGRKNVKGEWAVAYHGTPYGNVESLLVSPMKAGSGNVYGTGIYCAPDVVGAEHYASKVCSVQTKEGVKYFEYVFQCRVNVSSIHKCTQSNCPDAANPKYTLHQTVSIYNYWFVNQNNSNFENIRVYGLLVKEVPRPK